MNIPMNDSDGVLVDKANLKDKNLINKRSSDSVLNAVGHVRMFEKLHGCIDIESGKVYGKVRK